MRHRLVLRFGFESSHLLPLHDGKCANLHGHSYKLELCLGSSGLVPEEVEGEFRPDAGMMVDFSRVKKVVRGIIPDHQHLNSLPGLVNPTAELLAIWLYERIDFGLAVELVDHPVDVRVLWVRVWETATGAAEYRGG